MNDSPKVEHSLHKILRVTFIKSSQSSLGQEQLLTFRIIEKIQIHVVGKM